MLNDSSSLLLNGLIGILGVIIGAVTTYFLGERRHNLNSQRSYYEALLEWVNQGKKTRFRNIDVHGAKLADVDLSSNHNGIGIDLSFSNLKGTNLERAKLNRAILTKTNLTRANLSFADLREAKLDGANLQKTILQCTDLSDTDLTSSDLRNAHLQGTIFNGSLLIRADLRNTNLLEADLRNCNLYEADLRGANVSKKQLEDVETIEGAKF
jgi:uncharacterized protein YjbI with pentapeptide repeats